MREFTFRDFTSVRDLAPMLVGDPPTLLGDDAAAPKLPGAIDFSAAARQTWPYRATVRYLAGDFRCSSVT